MAHCWQPPLSRQQLVIQVRLLKGKHSPKRDKYSRSDTGACRLYALSYETFGRAEHAAFALMKEIAQFAASSGVVSTRIVLENAMRNLAITLC